MLYTLKQKTRAIGRADSSNHSEHSQDHETQNSMCHFDYSRESLQKEFFRALEDGDPEKTYDTVKQLAFQKKTFSSAYVDLVCGFRAAIKEKKEDERYKECLKALFLCFDADEFAGDQFEDVSRLKFPVVQMNSLRLNYVRRRRMKQIGRVPDRWLAYNKSAGEEFAQMVGIKTPSAQYNLKLEDLRPTSNICIKPNSGRGSRGVYIVNTLDDVWCVEKNGPIGTWEDMIAELKSSLKDGRLDQDCFEVQEAIYSNYARKEPVHDLKFYSFYGEVVAVAEIVRIPGKYTWWFDGQGEMIQKDGKIPTDIKPLGVTSEMFETAKKLSLAIPSPFVRLDFLRSEDDMYLTEFCTFSGDTGATMLEWVNPKWDHIYGNAYLKAEMRLIHDLLDGKQFPEICEFNRKYDEIAGQKRKGIRETIKRRFPDLWNNLRRLKRSSKRIIKSIKQQVQGEQASLFDENIIQQSVMTQDIFHIVRMEQKHLIDKFYCALEEDRPEKAFTCIKQLAAQKKASNIGYVHLADDFHVAILRKKDDQRYKKCLAALFKAYDVEEFSGRQFSDVYRLHLPILQASSLRLNYVRRRRMKQIGKVPDRWLTSSKQAAKEFAQMVGVKTSDIYILRQKDQITTGIPPVHELKFYSFYGEIVSVAEVVSATKSYAWWYNRRGKLIYQDDEIPSDMHSYGITRKMFKTAEKLSSSIPAPFVRLDYIRSKDDIYFADFCTFSGDTGATMLEWKNAVWDSIYGNAYLRAEMRLIDDLLAGKKFPEICELNRKYDSIASQKKKEEGKIEKNSAIS